jgi:hypothetical protein
VGIFTTFSSADWREFLPQISSADWWEFLPLSPVRIGGSFYRNLHFGFVGVFTAIKQGITKYSVQMLCRNAQLVSHYSRAFLIVTFNKFRKKRKSDILLIILGFISTPDFICVSRQPK